MMNPEKILAPLRRFPDFNDKEGWQEYKLGDIAQFYKGRGISKNDVSDKGKTPCIRYGELYTHYKEIIYKIRSYTNLPISDLFMSEANDVIIPSSGETKEDISTASCVLYDNIALGGDINVIRTSNDGVFLSYYLNNAKKHDIAKIAQGISIIHLYNEQLRNLSVALPCIEEQRKITECLSSIDTYIISVKEKIEQLKEHKKSLLQKLFPQNGKTVPEYRFPEFVDNNEWDEKKVSEIFTITRGHVLAASLTKAIPDDEYCYPVYSSQTSNNGLMGYFNEALFSDAITWTTDGANAGTVKYREGDFYCTNVCGVLLNKNGNANNCIAELLNTKTKKYVSLVGNPKLMNNVMAEIRIRIPAIPEQRKLAACFSSIDNLIYLHSNIIRLLEQQKKGLMQQIFPKT